MNRFKVLVIFLFVIEVACKKYINPYIGCAKVKDKYPQSSCLKNNNLDQMQVVGIGEVDTTFLMEFSNGFEDLGFMYRHGQLGTSDCSVGRVFVLDTLPRNTAVINCLDMQRLYRRGYFELTKELDNQVKNQLNSKLLKKESNFRFTDNAYCFPKLLQVELFLNDSIKVLCNKTYKIAEVYNQKLTYYRVKMKAKYFWLKENYKLLILPNFSPNIFNKSHYKYLCNSKHHVIYDCQFILNVKVPEEVKMPYLLVRAENESGLILNSDNDSIYFYRNKKFYKEFETLEKIEQYIEIEKKIKPDIKHYIYRSDSEFMKIVI
jgi:hypothetical protein